MAATGWFGVMARYIDDGNYYYLKVGNNREASLRKLVNGAISEVRIIVTWRGRTFDSITTA